MENQNIESKKTGRGGSRHGAGRKKKENGRNIRASFMFSEKANSVLEMLAEKSGTSKNDVLNNLLEGMQS